MVKKEHFHEHEDDHLIPPGYGIDEGSDGGFYPYRIVDEAPRYMLRLGQEVRCETYEQALEYIDEVDS